MAALCKRNRALGEERKSVSKQIDVWLHKNENSKSRMIKYFTEELLQEAFSHLNRKKYNCYEVLKKSNTAKLFIWHLLMQWITVV